MMSKKVASIVISASLVAGGVGIPTTLVYADPLPKTLIEYPNYNIIDANTIPKALTGYSNYNNIGGKQALIQNVNKIPEYNKNEKLNTSNKVFNINVRYIYNNKIIKNEIQQIDYNGSVKIDIPNGFKQDNISGAYSNIKSNGIVAVNMVPITYKVNYYVKYNGSYLKQGNVEARQKDTDSSVNLISGNLIPEGYEFSSATINGKDISESDLQNLYVSNNSTVIINLSKKTYNFKYTFKDSKGSVIKTGNLTYQLGNSLANLAQFIPKGYKVTNNNNLNNYNMFGKSGVDITLDEITHNVNWKLVDALTGDEISSGVKTINELNGNFNASTLIPKEYIYVASKVNGVYSTLDTIKNISDKANSNVVIAIEKESNVGLVTTKTNDKYRTATITYNNPNAKSVSLVVKNQSVNLKNSGNGVWTVTVPLPQKGTQFLYKFIVDGKSELGHGVKSVGDSDVFLYTPLLNTINYSVTYNDNELNKGSLNVVNGNNVSNLIEVIPSGYKFVSATVNGQPMSKQDITSIPDSSNYNVHICVEPFYNKISYEVKCGDKTLQTNSVQVYNTDYKSNLSKLIPNGYKFASATDNGKSISETDLQSISNSSTHNIVINIEPITYSTDVNFYNSETGNLIKTQKLNYTCNENLNFQDIGNLDGYTFKYVENNGVVLGGTNITEFSGSRVGTISIYETPKENTLSVSVEYKDKVVSTKSINVVNNNEYTDLTDMIPKGYVIANLSINGSYVSTNELKAMPNSTYGNVVIKIQPKQYNLTFIDSSTGKRVSSASVYEISDNGKCNYKSLIPSGYKVVGVLVNGVKTQDSIDSIPDAAGDITVEVENQMRTLSVNILDGTNSIYNVTSMVSNKDTTNVADKIPQGYEFVSATNNGQQISLDALKSLSDSQNNNVVINVKPVTTTLKVPVYNSANGWLITTETLNVSVNNYIKLEDIAKIDGYKFDYAEVNYARLDNVKSITGVGMKNLKIYLTPDNDTSTLTIKTEDGQVLATDNITGYSSKKDFNNLIPTGYTLDKLVDDSGNDANKDLKTNNKQRLVANNVPGCSSIEDLNSVISKGHVLDKLSSNDKKIPGNDVNLNVSTNFTAYVSKTKYDIKVNFYDETTGKVIQTKNLIYTYGDFINMSDFTKVDGYTFDYLESNGVHILDENMNSFNTAWWIQNNNLSVYMLPSTLSKSIKWVNAKDGSTITTSNITGNCNEEVDLTKLCPNGYTIKSIDNYANVSSDNKIELSKIDNMEIQVTPVTETLKVNYVYDTNNNNKTVSKTYTGNVNQTQDLTSNVASGYSIKSADVDGKSVSVDELKKMNLSDSIVNIYLEKNPTTISIKCIDSNTGKEISSSNLTTSDSSVDLTSYIPSGYKVTSVNIGNITTIESALKDVNPDRGNVQIYVQPTSITGSVDTKYSDGKLDVYFTNTTATEVSLNINVKGWSLYNMTNEGNGVWKATVNIPGGVDSVEYNFKVDNAAWTTGEENSTQGQYNVYKINTDNKQGNANVIQMGNGYLKVKYTNVKAKTASIHYLSDGTWNTKQMTYKNGTFSVDIPVSQSSTQLKFKFIVNGSDWVVANGVDSAGVGVYEDNIFNYGESAFAKTSSSNGNKQNVISGFMQNISNWFKNL